MVNGAVYALQYDVLKDFEPVALLASSPQLIVAKKGDAGERPEGTDRLAQGQPGQGVAGTPVSAALASRRRLLPKQTGTRFQFVPYRGSGPVQDLVAGQIDMMIDRASNAAAGARRQHQGLRRHGQDPLGSGARNPDRRRGGIAGIPLFALVRDLGAQGHAEDVIAKLNAAIVEALADPAVRQRLTDLGQEIFPREQQTPEALAAFHKAEIEKWWPIIKAAGIRAE